VLSNNLKQRFDDEMIISVLHNQILSKNEDDFEKHIDKLIVLCCFGWNADRFTENSAFL
jgi:hypothetical protein